MYNYTYNNRPWETYEDWIKNIVIGDGVTHIGDYAFYDCDYVTDVIISDTVKTIDTYAFNSCARLSKIEFPNSLTTIGAYSFANCSNLKSITIPDSVTNIEREAFASCTSLTGVEIPDSVTTIGIYAFYYCTKLTSITVDSGNKNYSSDTSGVLFNKDKTILIQYPIGNTRTTYTVPNTVSEIEDYSFSYSSYLTKVVILDSVTTVGRFVFSDSKNLSTVTFGNGITKIGEYTFRYCTALNNVSLPDGITTIDKGLFYGCSSLNEIIIPQGVDSIGSYSFYNCSSLTSLAIPDSVITIGNSAFYRNTSMTDVFYLGNGDDWNTISIGSSNEALLNANIHYLYDDNVVFVDDDMHVEGLVYELNSVSEFKNRINIDNVYIKVFNIEGVELIDSEPIGTGATVYIYDSTTHELVNMYTVVLYGDVNGDGVINDFDRDIISAVASCQYKIENEWLLMAADTNHDGAVDAFDVIETELQYLDMHNIEQVNNSAYISKKEDETEEQ